nr:MULTISPECIES: hypothetical protein [Amycolatopsis]
MVMLPVADTRPGVRFKYTLHLVEKLFRNKLRVPSRVLHAFVNHVAEVVTVAQPRIKRLPRYRLIGSRHAQAKVGQLIPQIIDIVLTCSEQLEGNFDVLRPLFIDGNRVDLMAIDHRGSINVSQSGAPVRSTILNFVEHFHFNVFAVTLDVHPVHDVNHGFHAFSQVTFAEVLSRRNKLDAQLAQLLLDYRRFNIVTEYARSHVDHDIIYVALFDDTLQELLKYWALVHLLTGVARLNVFVNLEGFQFPVPLIAPLALRWNRVTLWVDIHCSVHLLLVRDAQ